MHLSRLTTAQMVALSQSFLDPAHPAGQALSGMSELASLLSRLGETHQVLLSSQSADDLRADSLQKEVQALAAEHDDLARGIDHTCQGLALLSEQEEIAARWARIHQLLLPSGAGKVSNLSLQATAANAALTHQIFEGMAPQDKGLLKSHFIGKSSLFELIERWIAVGRTLGEKESERQSVPVTPTDEALQEARNQWAKTLGALTSMLQMSEILGELPPGVREHVLIPLRTATDRRPQRPPAAAASAVEAASAAAPESPPKSE